MGLISNSSRFVTSPTFSSRSPSMPARLMTHQRSNSSFFKSFTPGNVLLSSNSMSGCIASTVNSSSSAGRSRGLSSYRGISSCSSSFCSSDKTSIAVFCITGSARCSAIALVKSLSSQPYSRNAPLHIRDENSSRSSGTNTDRTLESGLSLSSR